MNNQRNQGSEQSNRDSIKEQSPLGKGAQTDERNKRNKDDGFNSDVAGPEDSAGNVKR